MYPGTRLGKFNVKECESLPTETGLCTHQCLFVVAQATAKICEGQPEGYFQKSKRFMQESFHDEVLVVSTVCLELMETDTNRYPDLMNE